MKYKISQYAKMEKVCYRTIWNKVKSGELKTEITKSNRIFIIIEDNKVDKVAVYCRISSSENKSNLERQKERVLSYCYAKGYQVEKIVCEVGSGLNDNRKKLQQLLQDPTITKIVVEHSDRFSRFGMNYIEKLLEMQGRKIEIINKQENDRDDLMQDFVSIITSFTARLYGQRRSKRNTEKLIKELSENA
ncbi:MAG: IS607 family transposase [Sphaerospermopsis sp.]|nr:IS607 family transposase [Sphaerospermopsis sp.]